MPMDKAQKWGAAFFCCLLLVTARSPAQFVEVSMQIEGTSWALNSAGQLAEHRRTNSVRCVFGTNDWLIEGEFTRNSKETWWCIGTNIFKEVLVTKDVPESEPQRSTLVRAPGAPLHVGDRFTTIYSPSGAQPLHGIAELTWLAFCSGSFLNAKGRTILPPFTMGTKENDYSDNTELFEDALALPRRIEIHNRRKEVVCTYEVRQSTNFAGWNVPIRFEITQNDPTRRVKPFWQGSATVTSIQRATQPSAPPDLMKQVPR
jgi:hypothetical protein